jgi:DNA-binding transcriptional regulator of glucitol operon
VLRKLLAPAWLWRHALVLAAFAGCVLMGRWQLHRAEATGQVLNWGYMTEWWFFAALGAGWWIRTVLTAEAPPSFHDRAGGPATETAPPVLGPRRRARTVAETAERDDAEDPALAAYNRRLAELAARDGR